MSPAASDLKKLASGAFLAFGGAVLGNGFAYLLGLVIARLLGAEVVGLYFLGLVFLQVASSVCRLGLAEGLLRYVSIHFGQGDRERVKGTVISALILSGTACALVSAALYLCSSFFSVRVFERPEFAYYMRWFIAALPFFTLSVLLLNAIQALKRMDLVVLTRDILQPTLLITLSLAFYWISRGVSGFLFGHFLAVLLTFAVTLLIFQHQTGIFGSGTPPIYTWSTLLHFSLPIAFGDFASYTFRWADTFLISLLRDPSETGIYNAALRTTLLLNLLASSVNALYGPIIANHHHHGRFDGVQAILKTLIRWCLTAALPTVLALAFLSKGILSLWGPEFVTGSTAMVLLSISQLLALPSCVLGFTLLMCGKQVIESLNVIFIVPVNIGLNLLLIPRYGIDGAAWAMLLSQILLVAMRVFELKVALNLFAVTAKYLKPAAALIPVSLVSVLALKSQAFSGPFSSRASLVEVALTAFLIVGSYLGVLWAMGVEEEDLALWKEIRSGMQRRLDAN